MSKSLSKYINSLDSINKSLIVLPSTSGIISITSRALVTGIPVGTASENLCVAFPESRGLVRIC